MEPAGGASPATVSVSRAEQVTGALLALSPALIYVPLEEPAAHPELAGRGNLAVTLPRIAWDRGVPETMTEQLRRVRDMGVEDALVGNLGMLNAATKEMGFGLRGDFGLEVFNSQALKELRHMGLKSAAVSFELKLAQIRDLSKAVDTEIITYGRLPLMIMENCIIRNRTGGVCRHACEGGENLLTTARGPVSRWCGPTGAAMRSSTPRLFSWGISRTTSAAAGRGPSGSCSRLETPAECVLGGGALSGRTDWEPGEYTRGLYYRDVE